MILNFLIFISFGMVFGHNPQVRETKDEEALYSTNNNDLPIFDYKAIQQMDLRHSRYMQQQQNDMKHLKNKTSKNVHPDYDEYQNIDRQDVAFIQPNAMTAHYKLDQNLNADKELDALTALVGQPPNIQLVGLHKLLQSTERRDYTPIVEHTVDIPYPRSKPNVLVNHAESNLEAIQKQLDLVSKAETQKLLADAQRHAAAQVEAQNQAIASAQLKAQQTLAKIAAQNKQLPAVNLNPAPILLQKEAIILKPIVQYAPNHLQKISVTKTQSITQGQIQLPPESYQQVNHETSHQKEIDTQPQPQPQYASRYAFGYKIKDVKMGNLFGHEEKRDQKMTKGHYHVLLPDGRLQKVEYYADDTGYHAKVTYENPYH